MNLAILPVANQLNSELLKAIEAETILNHLAVTVEGVQMHGPKFETIDDVNAVTKDLIELMAPFAKDAALKASCEAFHTALLANLATIKSGLLSDIEEL